MPNNFIISSFYIFHWYYGYLEPKLRGNEQGPDSISSFAGEDQEKFVKQDGEKKLKKSWKRREKLNLKQEVGINLLRILIHKSN